MLKSYKKTGEGIGNRNQSPTQIEIQKIAIITVPCF